MNNTNDDAIENEEELEPRDQEKELIQSLENGLERLKDEDLPRKERVKLIKQVTEELTISSGPLPPASEIQKYENVCPGAADRIITMAEKQFEHRTLMEKRVLEYEFKANEAERSKEFKLSFFGEVAAFLLCAGVLASAIICLIVGYNVAGLSSLILALGYLAAVFIGSRKNQKKQIKEAKEATEEITKEE